MQELVLMLEVEEVKPCPCSPKHFLVKMSITIYADILK
jgi:hypothetical protein